MKRLRPAAGTWVRGVSTSSAALGGARCAGCFGVGGGRRVGGDPSVGWVAGGLGRVGVWVS